MKIGISNISNCLEGSTQISTLLIGSTEVWSSGCQLSYESDHGQVPSSKRVPSNYALTSSDLPTLSESGWVFIGWDRYEGDLITEDTVITAYWAPAPSGPETWYFNDSLIDIGTTTSFEVEFTCNNINYTALTLTTDGSTISSVSYTRSGSSRGTTVYTDGWRSQTYRTITFPEAVSGELENFLTYNAIRQ